MGRLSGRRHRDLSDGGAGLPEADAVPSIGRILTLEEEFPLLEITNELFEIDDTRVTCSGGTASPDMILYLIGQVHGQSWQRKCLTSLS